MNGAGEMARVKWRRTVQWLVEAYYKLKAAAAKLSGRVIHVLG